MIGRNLSKWYSPSVCWQATEGLLVNSLLSVRSNGLCNQAKYAPTPGYIQHRCVRRGADEGYKSPEELDDVKRVQKSVRAQKRLMKVCQRWRASYWRFYVETSKTHAGKDVVLPHAIDGFGCSVKSPRYSSTPTAAGTKAKAALSVLGWESSLCDFENQFMELFKYQNLHFITKFLKKQGHHCLVYEAHMVRSRWSGRCRGCGLAGSYTS